MSPLANRIVLITGGGTGIGRAIAIHLAQAGARVVVVGRRKAPLDETVAEINAHDGQANAITCDLSLPKKIDSLGERLIEQFGAIDILVNNAGFSSKIRSTRYIGSEEWRAVMDVNTLGPAMLTRALLPPMIEKGEGDVVMISSMAALRPSIMAGAVYSAAKSAARTYMEVLAAEVRQYGIRCITVFPGEVDTHILDNRALPPDAEKRALMMLPEDIATAVLMALSLPRRAMVSEIAIGATCPRDMRADIEAAMTKQAI